MYFVNPKKPHKCSDVTCKNCGEFAHVAHRCYIQPIFEEQPQQQDDEDFEDSLQKKEKGPPPPTLNFAPIECAFTKDQAFEPNLIYWSSEEDKDIHHATTINEFLDAREAMTEVEDDVRPRKVSLHAWVNKYKEYPIRFPLIYTNPNDQNIDHYFGVALIDILPPERLLHPVLPYRAGGKLNFPLCAACVKEEQTKPWLERTNVCTHTDEERALRGTWATIEIQKAVHDSSTSESYTQ